MGIAIFGAFILVIIVAYRIGVIVENDKQCEKWEDVFGEICGKCLKEAKEKYNADSIEKVCKFCKCKPLLDIYREMERECE
jgi:hypothetical protein